MRQALAAAALLAALCGAGCGGDDDAAGGGPLDWSGAPRVATPPTLPDERVLTGRVANDSLEPVELDVADLRLLDESGERVQGQAVFLSGYVLPPEPRNRGPVELPEGERRRLGQLVRIEPGGEAPISVAWRIAGGREPVRLDYGDGTLALP
ncbi:MAG: hypothetical protein WD844_03200 [Thermoleophilaceae bacterium]